MRGARRRLPWIYFTIEKPAWWKQYMVVLHAYGRTVYLQKYWSWDEADTMCAKLNAMSKGPTGPGHLLAKMALRPGARISNMTITPYKLGDHVCCCGVPNCNDFENRMTEQGVSLAELDTVTYEVKLS